ncbi:MAG: glycine C-acetyltransferase [Candidatus Firestonebacteria bacterium RIFOXYA2_FULL_40_8]|nr:MAG: glycine C-acetyltransferase [Candidatus Firestonebacteria bacterium RIFOXYA2_FULL_40_8]
MSSTRHKNFDKVLSSKLSAMKTNGTLKNFREISSPMNDKVVINKQKTVVLSSNNYLGLSANKEVVAAGIAALKKYGAGTASVRFICGTFSIHKKIEKKIASFFGFPAALTYVSCWAANTGLIPAIAVEGDVIITDQLNHASLIDGIRMSKAERKIYKHSDMAELEKHLKESQSFKTRYIITDGVFSMEGDIAKLEKIAALAKRYDAVTIVDDSHGTGVLGKKGSGIIEHYGLKGKIDILTSTLGKALGGAAGGFVAGSRSLIDYLSQVSRPQLFSNALPPTVAGSALKAIEVLEKNPSLVKKLHENTAYFRKKLIELGLNPLPGESAIVPVIVGETAKAISLSNELFKRGVFVTGFGYPVVPEGTARIRFQMSAALSRKELDGVLSVIKDVLTKNT